MVSNMGMGYYVHEFMIYHFFQVSRLVSFKSSISFLKNFSVCNNIFSLQRGDGGLKAAFKGDGETFNGIYLSQHYFGHTRNHVVAN